MVESTKRCIRSPGAAFHEDRSGVDRFFVVAVFDTFFEIFVTGALLEF